MLYAYDNWVQLPTKDIYDTQMMAMAINAAKDMYEKGQDEIKDFTKTYGDFMSPFAKDMERYGEMVGGVKDTINRMYAAGIDPLRSAEGRAILSRLTNSINPAEFNMMRANAKTGYAYLDAIQDLRKKGKYSEAQELFDIMQTGGLGTDSEGNSINTFENFSTAGRGGWNSFTRTSPVEAATLQELTKSAYEGRTARLLSAADFNDPRLKGYTYDPNYEWSGYLYSDLLKGAPGAVMSASADPRMAYFRNIAEQKVAASGRPYTQADVEAQFQRDVADANTWALIDPTRKANEFALDDHRTKNDDWLDQRKQYRAHYYKMLEKGDDEGDGSGTKNKPGWNVAEDVYVTSLAKAAGMEYLPLKQGGVDANILSQMLKAATKNQDAAIRSTRNVFAATGTFISPEKIGGLIQADSKNGNGYFLNSNYFKNLHEIEDVRSSYKGWLQTGTTATESKELRAQKKQSSKDVIQGIRDWSKTDKTGYRVKVVPVPDDNGNNTYSMVGDDGRWHTYARVKVYLSDGKKDTKAGGGQNFKNKSGDPTYDIPKQGREMMLEVGLHSNQNAATPDLSVSAREDLGFYGYDYTTKKVGKDLNSGFPYTVNSLEH